MKSQIKTIAKALRDITKTAHGKKALAMLYQHGRYGWEKWLQVELALKLADFGDPAFEQVFPLDMAKKRTAARQANQNLFVDLVFRKSDHLKGYLTAIEIKINESEKGLKPVLADLFKIGLVKRKDWPFRCVASVLIFNKSETETKYVKILEVLREKFELEEFSANGYDFLIIGWEVGRTSNMTRSKYQDWYRKVDKIYRQKDVRLKFSKAE